MSDQVNRKKSYRWASASQTTYDGADWDSSETEDEVQEIQQITLPTLPKLDYSTENKETDEEEVVSEQQEDIDDPLMLSKNLKKTQYTDDLDNLMVQISKEMTPKVKQDEEFAAAPEDMDEGDENHDDDDDDDNGEAFTVSKNGYFSNMVQSDDETTSETQQEEVTSIQSQITATGVDTHVVNAVIEPKESSKEEPVIQDATIVQPDKDISNSQEETIGGNDESRKSSFEDESDPDKYEPQSELQVSKHSSKSFLSDQNSSDEMDTNENDDDALSYTDSICYEEEPLHNKLDVEDEDFKFTNKKVRDSILESSSSEEEQSNQSDNEEIQDGVGSSDDNITMNVPESGYFNNMMKEDDESNDEGEENSKTQDKESGENGKNNDDILSIPPSVESKGHDSDVTDVVNDSDAKGNDEIPKEETEADTPEEVEDSDEDDEPKLEKSRQSVNFGKWKPDTEALRSGFVQETSKEAPPGFVYDDSGNLVDLTPSSMKSRAVSTYSEMESGWNAFPSEENMDELEIVGDTKTLYDNNTIYNVPGIITRNQNLPPLPSNLDTTISDQTRNRSTSNATHNSDRKSDIIGIHEPNSQEMAKLNETHLIPELNLNKLISSNISNASKYEQLTDYCLELGKYDSGIQTWISYSLKSSAKDKDFLFDEYKNNRHVREAYANAEDLTKKNTVINTVNTVNQNVSHLRKKVFSHTRNSMKPKMLFSSISKKKL